MFPICSITGQVIGFTGRLYEETDGQPKYLNSPETAIFKKRDHLYGLHLAAQWCCNVLILVEGTMDVLMLNQAGFCNVAAPLGTALIGKKIGDRVCVNIDNGYSFYIVIREIEKGKDDDTLEIRKF